MGRIVTAEKFQAWADKRGMQIKLGYVFLGDASAAYSEDIDLDEMPKICAYRMFPDNDAKQLKAAQDWAEIERLRDDADIAPGDELRWIRNKAEQQLRDSIEAAVKNGDL